VRLRCALVALAGSVIFDIISNTLVDRSQILWSTAKPCQSNKIPFKSNMKPGRTSSPESVAGLSRTSTG
jgi:hypothetical protein